jgi:hypothetical protein
MLGGHLVLRTAAFLLAGALCVHEMRHVVSFGSDADVALSHHGHGYLNVAGPLVGLLTAFAFGHLLVRAASTDASAPPGAVRLRRWAPAASVALLGIYAGQELLEGALATGHPGGWDGVFVAGGWVAVPLAVVFGTFVALALRVAGLVESSAPLRMAARWCTFAAMPAVKRCPCALGSRPGTVLAEHLAGRSPPPFSV